MDIFPCISHAENLLFRNNGCAVNLIVQSCIDCLLTLRILISDNYQFVFCTSIVIITYFLDVQVNVHSGNPCPVIVNVHCGNHCPVIVNVHCGNPCPVIVNVHSGNPCPVIVNVHSCNHCPVIVNANCLYRLPNFRQAQTEKRLHRHKRCSFSSNSVRRSDTSIPSIIRNPLLSQFK